MNKFIPFSQKQLSVLNWWCKGSDVKIKTVLFVTERLGQAKRFVWVFRLSAGHFMLLAILRLPFAEKQFLHFAEMLLLRFCQRLKNLVSALITGLAEI